MKVGLILECGLNGPDQQVYSDLAHRLIPKIKLVCETMTDKPRLVAGCGKVAARLLAEGCQRVGVVWDLFPPWRAKTEEQCRGHDRQKILAALSDAGVGPPRVQLVCVQEELEAWLLADRRALTAFFSRPRHPAKKVPEFKNPEQVSNPKARLRKLFNHYKKGRYNEMVHALGIFKQVPDWSRTKRCPSFLRFVEKVIGARV